MLQELAQEIHDMAKDVVNGIHTALPGVILSYNGNTASVKPIGKYPIPNGDRVDYPTISDVPVIYPCSTSLNIGMFFPIKSGDSCLIVMSEIELDEWRSGKESGGALKFDLSSAICIPGMMRGNNNGTVKANADNAVVITAGNNTFSINQSGISIQGNVTIDGDLSVKGVISNP